MKYPKYAYIPQCVFPNQRDSEKIFVLTRRHFVGFISYIVLFFFLAVIPPVFVSFLLGYFSGALFELGVLGRDIIILFLCTYYLSIMSFFITAWVSYYYDIFIVTDERIIDITQKGLFSREIFELSFEQIEDVTTKTRGFLSTIFEAGDIEIQTAARQRNFEMKRVPQPSIVAEIIHSLTLQARNKKPMERRTTEMATVGLIERTPVIKGEDVPLIMNFEGKLSKARSNYQMQIDPPRTIRQYFDRWWWSHVKRDEGLYVNYDYIRKLDFKRGGRDKENKNKKKNT